MLGALARIDDGAVDGALVPVDCEVLAFIDDGVLDGVLNSIDCEVVVLGTDFGVASVVDEKELIEDILLSTRELEVVSLIH